jgi:glutamyl-tRNA synthetase
VVHDMVRGDVSFDNASLDDLILVRSDGVPTFHFGVVVDDADMEITHVIRGDDHLTNTPRQINILQALGMPVPRYAHLPMILGADGARLSKRHGAVNVLEYRDQGYLPQAILNYLVRLGWSHGDQEVFTREEMVRLFDLDAVNPAASRLDPAKLAWLNQHYIRTGQVEEVSEALRGHMERRGMEWRAGPPLGAVVEAFRERAVTLEDMVVASAFAFGDAVALDAKSAAAHLRPAIAGVMAQLRSRLEELAVWQRESIHAVIAEVAAAAGLGFGKLGQPLRVAVTGGTVSPPIDVTLELVGRERVLLRLQAALDRIAATAG